MAGAPVTSDSKIQSELDVLAAVERGEVVTQVALTRRVGISIGLINAVLKRAMHRGFIKTRQVPYKRFAYYLTPQGFGEKSRLVAEYLDRSLRFFRRARDEYAEIVKEARRSGMVRLVLAGTGQLAEIAVLAGWGEEVQFAAILDPQSNQSSRYGLKIIRALDEVDGVDAVLLTDSLAPQRTYEAVRQVLPEARILAPPFLKVTRDRTELLAAQERSEEAA